MTVQTERKYAPLTEATAIKLATELHLFAEEANLSAFEIGDGNLNLVFRIKDEASSQSIIIKQALPYAKVVGESWPLTLHRAVIESNALQQFAMFSPQHVPTVLYTDEILAVTIMEDLADYTILRSGLIQGQTYPKFAEHIGTYLAKTLFYSSDYGMNQQAKKELVKQYSNPELCKITEDLVFTDPFYDSDTNDFESGISEDVQALWADQLLKREVAKLKRSFLTRAEALLHGDLHTGSIFVTETETKVIDPEFAFYGPMGFDIGQIFANLLLNALSQKNELQQERLKDIEHIWDTFTVAFKQLWHEENVDQIASKTDVIDDLLEGLLADSFGFAGCEIIRRTIGLSHVHDLEGILDLDQRLNVKKQALRLGRRLILQKEGMKHPSHLSLD